MKTNLHSVSGFRAQPDLKCVAMAAFYHKRDSAASGLSPFPENAGGGKTQKKKEFFQV
jgi:hypothetical protein